MKDLPIGFIVIIWVRPHSAFGASGVISIIIIIQCPIQDYISSIRLANE